VVNTQVQYLKGSGFNRDWMKYINVFEHSVLEDLFFGGLFNDAVISSDWAIYRWMIWWLMNNEVERMWKEVVMA
jgi:hypothetical protein